MSSPTVSRANARRPAGLTANKKEMKIGRASVYPTPAARLRHALLFSFQRPARFQGEGKKYRAPAIVSNPLLAWGAELFATARSNLRCRRVSQSSPRVNAKQAPSRNFFDNSKFPRNIAVPPQKVCDELTRGGPCLNASRYVSFCCEVPKL